MTTYFRVPVAWSQIIRRTVREIGNDNCLGIAAQLAYYFLLALFPSLLFIVALIGYLPVEGVMRELVSALETVAPRQLVELLRDQMAQIAGGDEAGLVTIGLVGAIWSSSAAMAAIIDALNRAYDVTEWRSWWRRRLLSIALTIAMAVFVTVAMTLLIAGPSIALRLASWFHLSAATAWLWSLVRWPAILICVAGGVELVYHFAPNRRSPWVWLTPGSLVATALWVIISLLFKIYVANFGDYTATYGVIGGAIVTMLWFYVSSIAILVGAELNGVIEEAWRSVGRNAPGTAGPNRAEA